MTKGRKKNWVIGSLIVCVGIGAYLLIQVYGQISFPRSKLEAVVAQLRAENLEPGRVHRLRLTRFPEPSSLSPMADGEYVRRGEGRGLVWAEITKDGVLRVAFETRDSGHAGESGYLYSDSPVTAADIDELGREWRLGRKRSEHWWEIIYDLG